ncbi:MAG: 50S ribosomal protein L19 [Ignavibacteria bacterium]|jgi:large subunit ribosomal protein L19|nr:50S ribosomal protein L19 [Ignavibacteria bacterium]MBK9226535.1 50S ribosomal protein L19 [Ignavibacteria bacterium]
MEKIINLVTAGQIRNDLPEFHVGDTVSVSVNVFEGEKERIQIFKGIVMGIKGGGISKTFRVRKIANGVGVERIFPINSPRIAKVEILKHGIVRRAKLYYLRGLTGKAATKIKEKKKVAKVIETITEKVTEPVVQTAAVQESIES